LSIDEFKLYHGDVESPQWALQRFNNATSSSLKILLRSWRLQMGQWHSTHCQVSGTVNWARALKSCCDDLAPQKSSVTYGKACLFHVWNCQLWLIERTASEGASLK
jgi:hypothetical protein